MFMDIYSLIADFKLCVKLISPAYRVRRELIGLNG